MRTILSLTMVSVLVVTVGCVGHMPDHSGRRALAAAPATAAPSGYARATRTPVRAVSRDTSAFERRLPSFTPPAAPPLPVERVAVVRGTPYAPAPCAPEPVCVGDHCGVPALDCDPCADGHCGVPALGWDPCAGGACGVPSLDVCK